MRKIKPWKGIGGRGCNLNWVQSRGHLCKALKRAREKTETWMGTCRKDDPRPGSHCRWRRERR